MAIVLKYGDPYAMERPFKGHRREIVKTPVFNDRRHTYLLYLSFKAICCIIQIHVDNVV